MKIHCGESSRRDDGAVARRPLPTGQFLLNGFSVKIRLVRSKDTFSLMADGVNPDFKL